MKSFRKRLPHIAIALAGSVVLHGELAEWVQHIEAGGPLDAIFFRTVTLPGGPVPSRRPPRETIPDLTKTIATSPTNGDLVALRAREHELQLDFKAAEADWRTHAQQATDKVGAAIELADFYHRRLQPQDEFTVLLDAAKLPSAGSDVLAPAEQQTSWKLFERARQLVESAQLGPESYTRLFQAWLQRYPDQKELYTRYGDLLLRDKRFAEAGALAAAYAKAHPDDETIPVRLRAGIEEARGSAEHARAVYEKAYQPLWPPELVQDYFRLLERTRGLRDYLAKTRAAVEANPTSLEPATRLFYYYQQSGNLPQAHRALLEFRLRKQKSAWTPDELLTLARLFEATHNYPEAARHYHELYTLTGAGSTAVEQGLTGVIRVLLTAPEQPIRIGTGDLRYYRDIATMDPYPGFLNGILSLLFNSTYPEGEYAEQERSAVPYFHRAKAAELIAELDKRFTSSADRTPLHAKLIEAYGEYGENATVIRKGQAFLTAFPKAADRTDVALAMADAYARLNRTKEEFAVYDALLKELGARVSGVPIGSAAEPQRARSPEYARVLELYLARLASLKRIKEAIALYRTEIDRNPTDPGLYERFARFLDENRRAAEIEAVYTRAAKQFQDRTWYHKLARWYLRQKESAQFEKLTREVTGIFSGTELEEYFGQVVAAAGLDSALYRQVNLYAHQRFPHELVFVKNLVDVYRRNETRDPAAEERLLRQHWYYDSELRSRFFELLSRTGRLQAEIQALGSLPAADLADRAANQFIAEAQIWRGHFESGAPALQLVANTYPGDVDVNDRAASLFRSIGQTDAAARFANRISRLQPRNLEALARVGDIYADGEQFDRARPHWDSMTMVDPGRPDAYLEAATVYWDYYLFDDALRIINQGRTKLNNPSLLAFEAGAIYENRREYPRAIAEYMRGAMAEPDGAAQRRLLSLASRPSHRAAIESATASAVRGANPDLQPFNLRVALLEQQDRRGDLEALLTSTAAQATSFDLLSRIEAVTMRNGLDEARSRVIERQIALTPDPLERIRLRLASARLLETRNDIAAAERIVSAVHRENPTVLGGVRAAADFYWRSKQGSKAVDVLEQAASRANSEFRRSFHLEAARKATDIGEYARARKILDPMLASEPASADLIAATADTYARAGDNAGMRAFLTDRLKQTTGETQAQLRRTLIPVLVRMKDYPAALDQYIEILNRYADDEALAREAARFARRHDLTERLTTYYAKASSDSPRDARWPVVLARVQTQLENLDEALKSYTRALGIRPDRTDLLQDKAQTEERLMRFEDAAKSYARLYELTHRNPRWLVKSAESRARLGDKNAAIQAVRTAFLENATPRAQEYFEAARTLERWNWIREAKEFADAGLQRWQPAAMDALDQLATYMRLGTRLREYEQTWNAIAGRIPEGSGDYILRTAAEIVRAYFTPEEKAAFATFLGSARSENRSDIAQTAGLLDVAARALHEQFTANPAAAAEGQWTRLANLQQRRMQYSELAAQLESYWRAVPPQGTNRVQLLTAAAQAQRVAGNPKDELRLLGLLERTDGIHGPAAERYAELIRILVPARLVELASRGPEHTRNAAVQSSFAGSDANLALKAVAARGTGMPPVWTSAYTALTGLYFGRTTPDITAAFDATLGPRTVAEQLAAKADTTRQLVGDRWFPYAGRYGEYLALAGQATSDDFLPAELEGRPYAASLYLDLGDWFAERRNLRAALEDYQRALQLDDRNAEAYTRVASVLASQGKLPEAQAQWRLALENWLSVLEGRASTNFWPGAARTIADIGRYKSMPALRTDTDRLLRSYIRRYGQQRAEPLLEAAFDASGDIAWMVDLSRAAANPTQFLGSLVDKDWIPYPARDQIFEELLRMAEAELSRSVGQQRQEAQWALRNYRMHWIRSLLASGRGARAWTVLQSLDNDARNSVRWDLKPLEIRAAAAAGALDGLLREYATNPEIAASDEEIRRAVEVLNSSGQTEAAQKVMEFAYTRNLESPAPAASSFLGLAEIRIRRGDLAGATALIRRMNLIAGEPFEHLGEAAAMFERNGRHAEATELWRTRVRAVPWDATAASAIARLTNDGETLRRLAAQPDTPYPARVAAASSLTSASGLGSQELDLLASGTSIAAAQAEAPYYFHARVKAAEQASEPAVKVRLLRGAISIDPDANEVRAALFRAAIEAGQPSVSIATYYPMLVASPVGHWLQAGDRFQGRLQYLAEQFLSSAGLSHVERARIARDMASSLRKLDQLPGAILMLRIAAELEPSKDIRAEIESLEARQKVIEANRSRMPLIRDAIEQPHRVRPQLASQGGAQ